MKKLFFAYSLGIKVNVLIERAKLINNYVLKVNYDKLTFAVKENG